MPAYPRPTTPVSLRLAVLLSALNLAAVAAEPAKETPAGTPAPAPAAAPVERPIILDVHEVLTAPPKLAFGLALEVWRDNTSGKILNLYVTKVRPGSSAADEGLKPRTRIDRIDGRPVEQLTASFLKDGDLNTFFVNRKLGAKITLEILIEGQTQTKTVVLTEKPWFEFDTRIHDVERGYELNRVR